MAWKEFKWLVLYAKISTSTTFFSAAELILARKMLKIINFRTFSPSFAQSKTSTSGQRWKPCLETFSFF